MKKCLIFLLMAAACRETASPDLPAAAAPIVIHTDTVPALRQTVNSKPVAAYSEPLSDSLNNWTFAVSVYETKKTFQYLLRIQAKEVRVTDSIRFPDFGITPKPVIKKGKNAQSCIIGFLDKKNEFREYRLVSFVNDQLHIKTIKSYYVASYRTKQDP